MLKGGFSILNMLLTAKARHNAVILLVKVLVERLSNARER